VCFDDSDAESGKTQHIALRQFYIMFTFRRFIARRVGNIQKLDKIHTRRSLGGLVAASSTAHRSVLPLMMLSGLCAYNMTAASSEKKKPGNIKHIEVLS
jgi:hypothetical protein